MCCKQSHVHLTHNQFPLDSLWVFAFQNSNVQCSKEWPFGSGATNGFVLSISGRLKAFWQTGNSYLNTNSKRQYIFDMFRTCIYCMVSPLSSGTKLSSISCITYSIVSIRSHDDSACLKNSHTEENSHTEDNSVFDE